MPCRIRILDEASINKIAAGEVIENPASVVKELIENALDAASTEIRVEIKGGGRQMVRVSDNGHGMSKDDALLCLERHATSKIRNVEDIDHILTMGFRGEAIPSIASISKFTIITCEEGAEIGTMVIVEGGKTLQCAPVVRSPGTTMEVKALFFNMPVRRKFQRSPNYDTNEISKIISSIALANPHIYFQLISDQKEIFSTAKSDSGCFQKVLAERIQEVMGADFLENSSYVKVEEQEIVLEGYIGKPFFHRPNRSGQYLFINKRAINSPFIAYSIRNGFGTALPPNRHPSYVLHLTLPGELVDVNVHPQKREVRLRQEETLKNLAVRAVVASMGESLSIGTPASFLQPPNFLTITLPEKKPTPFLMPKLTSNNESFSSYPMHKKEVSQPPLNEIQQEQETSLAIPIGVRELSVIGTIKNFILVDATTLPNGTEGLGVINQCSAYARVLYEKLSKQKEKTAIEMLLLPILFHPQGEERELIMECLPYLQQIGIAIHQSGPHSFTIDAIPESLSHIDFQSFIREFLHQHTDSHKDNDHYFQEMHKKMAHTTSRMAMAQNRKISIQEAIALVKDLLKCETPYFCPLGKPTMVILDGEQMHKLFGHTLKR